jgi:pyruvate/2-oxoglutarate dehydrogenase complex dihydrolipoamide dehydrogenase (E3) component
MTKLLTPDICVIGAGSGGLSVAAAAAAFGVPVVLVEKGKMGGDCLNYGCVPSKALIAAGKQAQAMRSAAKFGIANVEPEIDFKAVMAHVRGVIASIAPTDSVERFTALGVTVIKAEAKFIARNRLVAGDTEIRARRFVIATGSSAFVPPIPGLEDIAYLTNETVFDLTRRPGHLVIVGGGPIGMELAQAFCRLGSQVTVLDTGQVLSKDDPELVGIVRDRLRSEGVRICERTRVARVEQRGKSGVKVFAEGPDGEEEIDGSHMLIATGRVPNTEGLDLKKAGVRLAGKSIDASAMLRTTNRRIYAVGDVIGRQQFTHAANYHAGLVVRALLFRLPAKDRGLIPWATYTDPQLAHVGLTEAQAMKRYRKVRILRWPLAENDRAQAEHKTDGHIKLVTGRKGEILGVSIVGAGASEMIASWTLAMTQGLKLQDITSTVMAYPTMSEIGKRAAITYFVPQTRRPLVRGIVRFLRLFG